MAVRLALAGDTMLGRAVAARLAADPGHELLAPDLAAIARSADLFLVNLECCISDRGEPAYPRHRFHFRAPPVAAERLAALGVACVQLANNHVLDFGSEALRDTLDHLRSVGIATVGAGPDEAAARSPVVLVGGGLRVRVVAVTDDPPDYAAAPGRPGTAFADLRRGVPAWLRERAAAGPGADVSIVASHWGPNMRARPVEHVRLAAVALEAAGATLVAGTSAHVPQGPRGRTLFDLGDFVDDYATNRGLRNDLGLLWLITLDTGGPLRVEGVPVKLEFAHTRLASDVEAMLLLALLEERCAAVGSSVRQEGRRLVFELG
jgi:poly-gamma-glutamate synthesis protein (capsule biosynthesis protein)